jgi:hypothetical protein
MTDKRHLDEEKIKKVTAERDWYRGMLEKIAAYENNAMIDKLGPKLAQMAKFALGNKRLGK